MKFIILLIFASTYGLAQGLDTVWTYNMQPDYLKNAVFSPDNQFVFATHYDYNFPEKLKLSKFDKVSGAKIWTTDTIQGIKQFSDDGKFFYTYDLKKYSYPEFQLVNSMNFSKFDKNHIILDYDINELSNLILIILEKNDTEGDKLLTVDLKAFNIIDSINFDRKYDLRKVKFDKKGENFILFRTITIGDIGGGEIFINHYYEKWDLKKKYTSIYSIDKSKNYWPNIIHFSRDGKLLGILTDSLRLFETENYNLVYTFPIKYIRRMNFSKDSKYIYLSIQSEGPYLFEINTKILTKPKFFCESIFFISDNLNEFLLTNHGYSLAMLKQIETSVSKNTKFKIEFYKDYIQLNTFDLFKEFPNIKIIDLKGIYQNISIKDNQDNSIMIDISSLISGTYILKLQNGNVEFTHKFIIAR